MDYTRYKISWKWNRGPHLEKRLSKKEGKSLLKEGGLFVRNTFDFDCGGPTAYWHIIKDSFKGIEEVPSKYRGRLRKSLELYDFQIVSKEFAIKNCYKTHKAAAENYRVKAVVPTFEQFSDHINSLDDSYEIWACIHKDGQVAGFALNHIIDDMCDYESMKYHPDYLKPVSPSYGLIYTMNEYYLESRKLKYVDDGARSITEHSDIQQFLIDKFRFRKAYCHVQLFYKWWFKLAVLLLFPFRNYIWILPIKAVLNMEDIARHSKPVGGVKICRTNCSCLIKHWKRLKR